MATRKKQARLVSEEEELRIFGIIARERWLSNKRLAEKAGVDVGLILNVRRRFDLVWRGIV